MSGAEEARRREGTEGNAGGVQVELGVRPELAPWSISFSNVPALPELEKWRKEQKVVQNCGYNNEQPNLRKEDNPAKVPGRFDMNRNIEGNKAPGKPDPY